MTDQSKPRVGRRPALSRHAGYPKLLYHAITGQMRRVLSEFEELSLGPEWGSAQMDVRYGKTPPPITTEPARKPPVFKVNLPGADE
jgi:hypothetical protein